MAAAKHKGVKRSGKPCGMNLSETIKYNCILDEERVRQRELLAVFHGKCNTEDMFILALKRMNQGWGPKRFAKLNKLLAEVRHEFEDIHKEDKATGMVLDLAFAQMDEELKQAVGEENFVDFMERYDPEAKTYGIRTFELSEAKRNGKPK